MHSYMRFLSYYDIFVSFTTTTIAIHQYTLVNGASSIDPFSGHNCLSFQVISCDTRTSVQQHRLEGNKSHLTHLFKSTNICYDEAWKGNGMKMEMYHSFAVNVSQNAKLFECEPVLIFIDGDVLFNNEIDRQLLQQKWLDINADIVLSTEMSCWIGRDCTLIDFQALYAPTTTTDTGESIFINSGAFMGRPAALIDFLGKAIALRNSFMKIPNSHKNWQFRFRFDDQYAITQIAMTHGGDPPGDAGQGKQPRNWTIRRDVTQGIFGSFLLAQPNSSCPIIRKKQRRSCYDSIKRQFYHRGCCTNVDIDISLLTQMFQMVDSGRHVCAIVRSLGSTSHALDNLVNNHDNLSMVSGTTINVSARFQPWKHALSYLHAMPLFWHGNGRAKRIFRLLQKQVKDCRNQHFGT